MSDAAKPQFDLHARCACTAVEITARGTPVSMLLCACLDCQKATGTGHSAVILMRQSDVTIVGQLKAFAREAASGATLTRSFCPECGTPACARSSRAPDIAMLPAGLFGQDAAEFMPKRLIFARTHHAWDALAPGLERNQTYPR